MLGENKCWIGCYAMKRLYLIGPTDFNYNFFQILEGMKVVRAVEALDDGSSKPTKEAKIANSGEIVVETPFAVAKEPSSEDK